MFDNVGNNLKTFALVEFGLGIVSLAIFAVLHFFFGYYDWGDTKVLLTDLVIFGLSFFAVWLSALVLYAIGDISENTARIAENTRAKTRGEAAKAEPGEAVYGTWCCDACGATNSTSHSQCKKCGKYKGA